MTKFKKIGEIQGYKQDDIKEVAETLEKQGNFSIFNEIWKSKSWNPWFY